MKKTRAHIQAIKEKHSIEECFFMVNFLLTKQYSLDTIFRPNVSQAWKERSDVYSYEELKQLPGPFVILMRKPPHGKYKTFKGFDKNLRLVYENS